MQQQKMYGQTPLGKKCTSKNRTIMSQEEEEEGSVVFFIFCCAFFPQTNVMCTKRLTNTCLECLSFVLSGMINENSIEKCGFWSLKWIEWHRNKISPTPSISTIYTLIRLFWIHHRKCSLSSESRTWHSLILAKAVLSMKNMSIQMYWLLFI